MPRLPPPPDLDFEEAIPQSREHGDVYFSGEGLSEKREVFLRGCGLPEGWAGREQFTVGELGFGTGLNLLALWDLWRRHRPSATARLHLVSFEGALIPHEHAARIHAAWPELGALSAQLRERWPDRACGMRRIALQDGVTLTLAIGDVAETLPQATFEADAWFLDGFAPAKNPAMWTHEVLGHVVRLCAPGARAATYTVAGHVRRTLSGLGFAVEKVPGHGRKKERLEARLGTAAMPRATPRRVAIIGAGVAGAWAARAFLDRGCAVDVHDRAAAPASGASGNALALVMPRLDAADGPAARALIAAWLHARRAWASVGDDAAQTLDAMHLPRGSKEVLRFAKILADPPLDCTILRGEGDGLVHVGAMAIRPALALPRLLAGAHFHGGSDVASLEEIEADLIVVCAGMGAAGFAGLGAPPLEGRLGQIESCDDAGEAFAIADGGYAVRALGQLVFGATFDAADGEPRVSDAARVHNLGVLARLRADIVPGDLTSRAAIRATTQDRMPFAGAPAQKEKAPDGTPAPSGRLRLIGGLGSRGFLWAPLLAEIVASDAFGEPSPVERSVAECLDPERFLVRALKRGSQDPRA